MYYVKKYEHKLLSDTLRFLGFTIKWGIHENGYWLTNINYTFDYILSNLIIKYFKEKKVKSVVDVGCGYGHYVNELNFHKIKSIGFDGNYKLINSLNNESLYVQDATDEYLISNLMNKVNRMKNDQNDDKNKIIRNVGKSLRGFFNFDYVLCLNVGEYIPKKKEEIFLKNLDRLNDKGIIISWDKPNSFNIGTINEKDENEILEVFLNNYNYTYDEKNSKIFRDSCNNDAIKKCIYVFEKKKR
ncbi:conserved Plasmodium protein, unknown function [Plasmodium sp. gorilla clade G2]|uniref:conserved Plasmodium protein, unknown function n=1 Tax=Plasmodium sp. gorilla clade G2 TaxID=880535 RepID=UPI000D21A752|nr:conserved Plasmodium protein, unknown function [Plasmodium sp. gorilla clade G2]SOV11518.1 conserved Plasmodium protein, unknown function [Plasmodium sp. gorilla clade G2]